MPAFINRKKVPRAVEPVPRPGDVTKHTVLNVFGDLIDGYFILDRLKVNTDSNSINKKLSYRRETARQLRIHAQLTRCFSAVAV